MGRASYQLCLGEYPGRMKWVLWGPSWVSGPLGKVWRERQVQGPWGKPRLLPSNRGLRCAEERTRHFTVASPGPGNTAPDSSFKANRHC